MSSQLSNGILTAQDLNTCRQELKDIIIAPFDSNKCKGIGYNLSPTEFCYSVRKKRLLKVHKTDNEVYVLIPPHDTVLTISNEYLKVSSELAGCFLSRVRPVTSGLGNISTTLDPGWNGMLLLPISNPSSKRVKLVIKTQNDDKLEPVAIVTMLLWRTNSSRTLKSTDGAFTFKLDNPPMRTDIWDSLASGPPSLLHSKRNKLFKASIGEMKEYEKPINVDSYIFQIKALLTTLEQSINHSPVTTNEIRDSLINIYHLFKEKEMPNEIVKKIKSLFSNDEAKALDNYNDFNRCLHDIVSELSHNNSYKDVFANRIQALRDECMYQELCEQVDGIHDIISNRIKRHWNKGKAAALWERYIKPHIGGIVATVILMVIFFSGLFSTPADFVYKIMISLVPVLTTLIFDRFDHRKTDNAGCDSINGT